MDRTPFRDLVHLVEKTVKSENSRRPNRPIYLVGESFGACLALAVAALNPNIDLMLILANPATSFSKSQLQPLLPLMGIIPEQLHAGLPYILNLATGDPLRTMISSLEKGSLLQQTVGELSQIFSVLADILPKEAHLWKLQLLRSASSFVNSRIHAVKAPTLILASGRDQLLPSQEEAERLYHVLPTCQIRNFKDCGHLLLMEDEVDLVTVIKGAGFYRRTSHIDYVSDYFPPTPFEFNQLFDSYRWLETFANPVMFSTLENGKIVKGLEGIPNEGPVILVGYHMLLGFELAPMIARILTEKNILVRGIAHPFMFEKALEERLPDTSGFDVFRLMGAVPVSASNFYRLLSSKSHVLLYPGGVREALHRKGEEYKLYWPEQSEFVRMAARFGAKIVPFGVVGEDDICDVVLDYEDLMKIPFFRSYIEELNDFTSKSRLRTDVDGEIAKQDMHFPGVVPKVPGRFYYLFGKPIETEGRRKELRNREEAGEVYLYAKSEVERCIAYLKEKREKDPYRNLLPRLIYQTTHGFQSEVPTFDI